jgi:hypothetical protein
MKTVVIIPQEMGDDAVSTRIPACFLIVASTYFYFHNGEAETLGKAN